MNKLYAVSDIHGNLNGFVLAAVQAGIIDANLNWIAGDSTLVNLGDGIDRGPQSREVIDLLIKLCRQAKEAGGLVKLLMGNHCAMLLDGRTSFGWYDCWIKNGGFNCIESYSFLLADKHGEYDYWDQDNAKKIYEYHREYFDALEEFCVIDNNLFVHAGVEPGKTMQHLTDGTDIDYTGSKSHLWIRDQFYRHSSSDFVRDNYGVKRIIFGHSPTTRYILKDENTQMAPVELMNGKLLGLDLGSYYPLGGVGIIKLTETSYELAGIAYNADLKGANAG